MKKRKNMCNNVSVILFILITLRSSTNSSKRRPRISQGANCEITDHPYYVEIRYGGILFCGGSIINSHWILTAAHCDPKTKIKKIIVIAGTTDSELVDEESQVSQMNRFVAHSRYQLGPKYDHRYDIAIAKLNQPFLKTNFVKFVKLEKSPVLFKDCSRGKSVGKGSQAVKYMFHSVLHDYTQVIVEPERRDYHLKCIELDVVPADKYYLLELYPYPPFGFAARGIGSGQDTCQGDSGGPFLCNNIQVGVVSRGIGCGQNSTPGIYTRVHTFAKWIESHVSKSLEPKLKPGSNIILFILVVTFKLLHYFFL